MRISHGDEIITVRRIRDCRTNKIRVFLLFFVYNVRVCDFFVRFVHLRVFIIGWNVIRIFIIYKCYKRDDVKRRKRH